MLVKSVKSLPLSIKSINPIEEYPNIFVSYACILKIFVVTKDSLINLYLFIYFLLVYVQFQNYQNNYHYYLMNTTIFYLIM